MALVTLTTDFGLRDPYVGVMKGVILGRCPRAQLVDLTHAIEPQNVAGAALQWKRALPHFPPGCVHLGVVDPGVGSSRRAIAAAYPGGFLVGPDNGLFEPFIDSISEVVVLATPPNASATFHGRDVFAPAVGRLAAGEPLRELGEPSAQALQRLPEQPGWRILWRDHFGNLISNYRGARPRRVLLGQREIPWARTYSDVEPGALVALWGSDGYLEIACRGGSAAAVLNLDAGACLHIESEESACPPAPPSIPKA